MHKNRIGIIILAAGASVRMGTPKQLLKIAGVLLIRRVTQIAIDTNCHPAIVVLGANAGSIFSELKELDVIPAVNFEWQKGISSSIHCGLKTLIEMVPDTQGALLMLADQPGISADSLGKILHAQSQNNSGLVAAHYNGVLGTPAFFGREYFDELLQLDGKGGARALLEKYHEHVLSVDLPEAAQDLDTPQDIADFNRNISESSFNQTTNDHISDVFEGTLTMKNFESSPSPDGVFDRVETLAQGQTRRQFIANVTVAGAGVIAAPMLMQSLRGAEPVANQDSLVAGGDTVPIKLRVNGTERVLQLDPRVTLLDALRERMDLNGSKKGCDHGQCGACTVLVNGRRINSCLALAVVHDGDEITTIEGLANGEELHPVQTAFLEQDGFQCGYCTPGQICSAVALLKEEHAGNDAEIREWMSGNICRCGAYTNIVAAIREAKIKSGGAI